MPSDEELMTRYVAGDRAAFRELFHRYAPVVLRLVRRGLHEHEALDLVQQTFLLLHRARHDFDQGSRLRPWLCTIAINTRRQYWRDTLRHKRADAELDPERLVAPAPAPNGDVVGRVRAAIALLPTEQREVIVLHWMEGLSYQEISQVVGASLSAVKVRAHRGYQVMRRSLRPGDGGPT